MTAVPVTSTADHAGSQFLALGEAAVHLGVTPGHLFQAGLRGELRLIRMMGRWAVERWEAEAWLAQRDGARA